MANTLSHHFLFAHNSFGDCTAIPGIKKNMLYCDKCIDGTAENDMGGGKLVLVRYLWLPSVTVGTMEMLFSGLKRGRREPYHVLTNVSLWKPAHSTQH